MASESLSDGLNSSGEHARTPLEGYIMGFAHSSSSQLHPLQKPVTIFSGATTVDTLVELCW